MAKSSCTRSLSLLLSISTNPKSSRVIFADKVGFPDLSTELPGITKSPVSVACFILVSSFSLDNCPVLTSLSILSAVIVFAITEPLGIRIVAILTNSL